MQPWVQIHAYVSFTRNLHLERYLGSSFDLIFKISFTFRSLGLPVRISQNLGPDKILIIESREIWQWRDQIDIASWPCVYIVIAYR